MAQRTATYTWADVLNAIAKAIPPTVEESFATAICNLALNTVWQRWDWRESIAKLPPFFLIPNTQDHGAPAVTVPSDFMGLRQAYLVRCDTTPITRQELKVIKDVRLTHSQALPSVIGYEPASKAIRVFPRVPANIGAPIWMIDGEYKMRPTKVVTATMNTTLLPFDDIYYDMWIDVARWAAYKLATDPRAGTASYANGQSTFSGQMAEAMHAIDTVARNEGLELGDPVIAPAEALVSGGSAIGGFLGIGF